jgi:hypothetical protein
MNHWIEKNRRHKMMTAELCARLIAERTKADLLARAKEIVEAPEEKEREGRARTAPC